MASGVPFGARLREADIMHQRLNTFREFLDQPQADAINLISWLQVSGATEPVPVSNVVGIAPPANGSARGTTPALGQHTGEILREHGFSPADIALLVERNIVA